jgi:hypothetical protein
LQDTCFFCNRRISVSDLNNHHVRPKSEGGTATVPTHKSCHINHHSTEGHFRAWGRIGGQISAITCQWAFTLKHVKDNPAYELQRQFYRMYYARA